MCRETIVLGVGRNEIQHKNGGLTTLQKSFKGRFFCMIRLFGETFTSDEI